MAPNVKWTDVSNNTNPIWYKDASLRRNVALGLGLCLVITTNGYQASLLTGFQAMPSWQQYFKSPKGALLGIYVASFFIPSIFTSFIGDIISTRWGRRWCIFIANIIILAGSLVNAFATSIGMWCGDRAIMGVGVGIIKVATPVLIQEIAHPRLRPILGSLYQTSAYLGIFFAAFMTFAGLYVPGDWGWRFPSVLQALGPILVNIVVFFCPESPRWLVKNGQPDKAHDILAKLHANGDKNDALVELEMKQITEAIERESLQQQVAFLDFLRTPGNRRRFVTLVAMACSLNWMGNGIIAYFLSPILNSVGISAPIQITLINAGLACSAYRLTFEALWNLLLAIVASVVCDKAGRRPLFLISIIGMLCSYILVMGLSAGFANTKNHTIGIAVIPFLFIYYGFYDIAFTPLPPAYTVEIMPCTIRSKGMALFTSFATLGNAFNQFVNPIALGAIGWKYYGVYIAILVFYLGLVFFMFPETKRLSAEDASRAFDYDRQGRLRGGKDNHPETGDRESEEEKECPVSKIEHERNA
ncbi:hexose transporter protein [Penicillium angulare]|uniref:Hexose transporter protein n=1 Tax=Penicillium angulare TaxID=116970 RepID=A0A9W9GDU9_9EURO|nr:hexose transporter protein [Penicillium angulare]